MKIGKYLSFSSAISSFYSSILSPCDIAHLLPWPCICYFWQHSPSGASSVRCSDVRRKDCTNAVSGTRFCHGYCQAARRNTKGKDMLCWRYVCFYFPGCRIARSYNHHSPLFQMDLVLDDHKLERNKAGLGFPSNYDLSAKFNLSFSDSIT